MSSPQVSLKRSRRLHFRGSTDWSNLRPAFKNWLDIKKMGTSDSCDKQQPVRDTQRLLDLVAQRLSQMKVKQRNGQSAFALEVASDERDGPIDSF